MPVALTLILVFCGGFSIMSVELLGGRLLAPYFGSSIYVWGSLITVFMLSLSIGYLLGGRWSVHNPSAKRLGMLFILAAVALVPMLTAGDLLMDWVFDRVEDPRYGSLLASTLLFFVPTVLLGMVSPYAVRLLVDRPETSGRVAGTLYFVSTIGSALGTVLTSFYLVLWFEVSRIIGVIAAVLIVCGLVSMATSGRRVAA